MKNFDDLEVWKIGHTIVLSIYALTDKFPTTQQYSLSDQMQRSAVSITSNIAEGYGRRAPKDKTHFYVMSQASAYELQNQLMIARDLKFVDTAKFETINNEIKTVQRILSGLINAINKDKNV